MGTFYLEISSESTSSCNSSIFHARNSRLFYRLSAISDTLRTAKLPSELFSQENRVIKVRIGNPVSVKDQAEHPTLEGLTNFLRKKTYMLANPYEKKPLLETIPQNLNYLNRQKLLQ